MATLTPKTISAFYGEYTRLKPIKTYRELLYIPGGIQEPLMSLKRQALCSSYSKKWVIAIASITYLFRGL